MENTNWLKQTVDKPLFPDLIWSRPENKRLAGKLLIIGGNLHSFAAVGTAYSAAEKAGVGTARAILPDALQKTLGKVFPEAEFAPSTPSGSFARNSLDALLAGSKWADGALLAGDFGRNSETAILLESFLEKYDGQITLTGDTVDYFLQNKGLVLNRPQTTIVTDLATIQKLASPVLIRQNSDLSQVIIALADWLRQIKCSIMTEHAGQVVAGYQQQISTTPIQSVKQKPDNITLAAYASVWQLQQPEKPFEALASAIYCLLT